MIRQASSLFAVILLVSASLFAQTPQITGITSSASWTTPVAPGSIVSVFGTNLAAGVQYGTLPLPPSLGGTSVSVNGTAAPLLFVSANQINMQMPQATSATAPANVVVTTAAGSSAAFPVNVAATSAAFYTLNGSGCGEALALVTHPDGTTEINSPANSAQIGDWISFWGTGFGKPVYAVADGAAGVPDDVYSQMIIDQELWNVEYSGLAPGYAGLDQVNIQVPQGTREGCSVPITPVAGQAGPTVTMSLHQGRGQCVDPPITSWGWMSLDKTTTYGPTAGAANSTEMFTAAFPSGPGLQIPAAPQPGVSLPSQSPDRNITPGAPPCTVPGYAWLSAGNLNLQPPSSSASITVPFGAEQNGATYNQTLPAGTIVPGNFAVSGTPGSQVGVTTAIQVGSPIQLQTSFPVGTQISPYSPPVIRWTGGDPGTIVKASLILEDSPETATSPTAYAYADASAGMLTLNSYCGQSEDGLSPRICTWFIPTLASCEIQVEVLPNPATLPTVPAAGVTAPVQLSWSYTWVFKGLIVGD